jgi:hypothetical protein
MHYKINKDSQLLFANSFADIPLDVYFIDCSHLGLTSLNGCPPNVIFLDCSYNNLTLLDGCPLSVTHLNCNDNHLISLKRCPQSVLYLECSDNNLTSLEGCPPNLKTLNCYFNQIKTLEYYPLTVTRMMSDSIPPFEQIISYSGKLKRKYGILLERVSKLIDQGFYPNINDDPTIWMPLELYNEIMSLPICPRCGKRGLLVHTVALDFNKFALIPTKTCCY